MHTVHGRFLLCVITISYLGETLLGFAARWKMVSRL
jgi:hypothetical protein